jgi:hypothetical protein
LDYNVAKEVKIMCYTQKLMCLLVRCLLFGIIGGAIFTVISGADLGLIPYVTFSGLGAGWHLTRPLGVVAVGPDGILFTAFFFAVRVGIALILGWLVLVPYTAYLIVRCIRN